VKELTQKILEAGLVDEATAKLMERWGNLPEGAAELVKTERLKDATRAELLNFGEELGDALDKERRLRETMLDMNQLRWPTQVMIYKDGQERARHVTCVIDRMGRYYFRPQDVKKEWFVPGYELRRIENDLMKLEVMLDVTELYVGDQVAAIQVSTK
jgi:hypothetical protein